MSNVFSDFFSGLKNDLSMGLGFTEKDQDFVDRTAATIERTQGSTAAAAYASQMADRGFADNYTLDDGETISADQTKGYVVKSGDTLGEIAARNGTTVADIAAANGIDLQDVNTVYVGQNLVVPTNTKKAGESVFSNLPSGVFVSERAIDEDDYFSRLEAAGEEDQSLLDELAAADTTGIDVFTPTDATAAAVEEYYTEGAGAAGATQEVDYDYTSSGEEFEVAAQMDDEDISGGVFTLKPTEEYIPLSAHEQNLVEIGWTDNGDGTITPPSGGGNYDGDRAEKWDWNLSDGYVPATRLTEEGALAESIMSAAVGLTEGDLATMDIDGNGIISSNDATLALQGQTAVEVNTFSDQEVVVPGGSVGDLYGFEDTVLESGTSVPALTVGTPMTEQLATELGITFFEGDTLTSADLEDLQAKGFDVDEDAIVESLTGAGTTGATVTFTGPGATDQGSVEVEASITPARLEEITEYANSLGVYTAEDLDAAGFTAAEIAAFEQGVAPEGLSQTDIDALESQYGVLQEAPGTIEEASNAIAYIKGNPDLSLAEIAQGLGFDTVGGFLEELALRTEGTGTMADDALEILAEVNLIPGAETYINPEYVSNLQGLQDMNALDMLALENQAAQQGVSVASLLDPTISATTGESIPMTLSDADISVVGDALQPVVALLDESSASVLASRPQDYLDTINAQMPDPNNEGYNMAGEPITPGLWMASVAAQELLGLGLDVATVMALGPVAGGAVAFQQGTAEAGQAAANETVTELNTLKEAGALDHLSDEEFNEAVDAASTQAFYTSGVAGGVVDTAVALTAGGFAPLANALPTAINSALTGLGVLGVEGVSGGLEQVGVNAAVIKALEEQGIDPTDYDKGYLDQVITAAIYEAVGGTGASAASMVGSAIQNLSADGTGATDTTEDFDASSEVTPFTNTQAVNTIETQTVTDAGGQTYTVDTAVDANGQTSVTVTNDATGASTTTNVNSGTMNSVNVGSETSIIVDSSDTANSGSVNTTVLESGGSLTQTGVDGLTGEETTVTDLQNTEDAVVGGTDQNVTVTNVGGVTTLTNDTTGFTAVVGTGTDANLINATNAVQNSDADAAVAAGAVIVDTTASETLLSGATDVTEAGATDATDETNVVQLFDPNKLYKVGGTHYVGNPANGVLAEGEIDGNLYSEGQLVIGMDGATAQTGTGGIGTLTTGGTDATTTGGTSTDATTDATASTATDATTDSNTTVTQNNDATVTTSNDGNVTVTTVTDANGNATVTTQNSVTGETTTDNVAVNSTATVTNGGVTVDVNAATDGTTTTTTESTVEGVVDVGTTAEAITQAATTTSVEEPEVVVEVQEPVVEEPVVEEPVVETQTSTVSSVSDDSQEEEEAVSGYTSGIAGIGGAARPVVAPRYQAQQTGLYSFYKPDSNMPQSPTGPVITPPTSYLAPTSGQQYGYGFIAPNMPLSYLARLAQLQGTGAEKLPSEYLMDGS